MPNITKSHSTDAVKAFKTFAYDSSKYNYRYMKNYREPKELLISFWQPSRLGVFLDSSCNEGLFYFNYVSKSS